jgi:hypothetical protein
MADRDDMETSQDADTPRRSAGQNFMTQGLVWIFIGSAVTLVSFFSAASSPYGGHYVIAYGAIIFGLAQYFRGRAAVSGTDNEDEADELLEEAAELESIDRDKAIAVYAEIVRKFPGTHASNEAQENMHTLRSHRGC